MTDYFVCLRKLFENIKRNFSYQDNHNKNIYLSNPQALNHSFSIDLALKVLQTTVLIYYRFDKKNIQFEKYCTTTVLIY